VLTGKNLFDGVRVDLNSTRATAVHRGWRIQLDPGDIEITQVEHPDNQTLRFTIPAGLAFGHYDLTAVSPGGVSIALGGALTVTEDPARLQLRIETQPDGAGQAILERSLEAGETLDLYALLRTERDVFVRSDVAVSWSVSGPAELTTIMGTSTRLSGRAPGDAMVRAEYGDNTPAQTGTLHIVAGPATTISIEDAPGGAGTRVGDLASLTCDDTLTLYALARDRFDNFVADVPVVWSVSGGIAETTGPATNKLALALQRPGTGRVSATHPQHGAAQTGLLSVAPGRAVQLAVRPDQANAVSGGQALQFTVAAQDGDGNTTQNTGLLTWSIGAGPITAIDPQSGLFKPQVAGAGRVRVSSPYGAQALSGAVQVLPGKATTLDLDGTPTQLTAGAAPVPLVVHARDAAGNSISDVGPLTWSLASGTLGTLDSTTGVLTPRLAGTAVVRARNAEGLAVDSQPITIVAGPAASLEVTPTNASITTDSAPLIFSATARDANGNLSNDIGALTWSIASGALGRLDAMSGVLDPQIVGVATLRVSSSNGVSGLSGTIQVTPGRVASLTIEPDTLTAMIGDAATSFSTTGKDADGNLTPDLGALAYSIASGPIAAIDIDSGLFTAQSVGTGSLRVTSSYGLSDDSGVIDVVPFVSRVTLAALRTAAGWMWTGQQNVRVEVDVHNDGTREAPLTGVWFTLQRNGFDVTSQYLVVGDYQNLQKVAPKSTVTLVYHVSVSASASSGMVVLTANIESFHPQFGPARDAQTMNMAVVSPNGPSVTLNAPLVPANRLCVGGSVTFACATSPGNAPEFAWVFAGGTPNSSVATAPSVAYAQAGNFPYAVTVRESFFSNTALASTPIFVGDVALDPAASYPTGTLVFSAPVLDPSVDMTTLPRDDVIAMATGNGQALRQCDGSPVAAGGQRYVTLFVDRGQLDPALDVRADVPGLQVTLSDGQGQFADLSLLNGNPKLEGPAMVYGEYFHPGLQRVTAAGSATFRMTRDKQAPTVVGSLPASDCGSGCFGKGKPWVFRFSEPMNANSLDNLSVERLSGFACTGSAISNLTAASSYSYDASARTLFVYPATLSAANYSVRVTLGAQLTDAAAAPNALAPYARCAGLSALPASGTPQPPLLSSAGPNPFSPDGDGVAESTTWDVGVDAATRLVRLSVSRGPQTIWATSEFVSAAGTYAISWDGRDSGGRTVADGFYRYDITAYGADGSASAAISGVIEVDSAIHFIGIPRRY
jgi:hypothetical protein